MPSNSFYSDIHLNDCMSLTDVDPSYTCSVRSGSFWRNNTMNSVKDEVFLLRAELEM